MIGEGKPMNNSYNKIEFGEGTFNDPEEGEMVEFHGEGKIIKKPNGSMCVDVTNLNGVAPKGSEEKDEMEMGPDEESNEEELAKGMEASSEDLKSKLGKMNEGKDNMYS